MTRGTDRGRRADTLPESQMRRILEDMKRDGLITKFIGDEWVQSPFRRKGVRQQFDFLVDDVLVIEVQGKHWHLRTRRVKKDNAKRESFETMGYGVLWIWDDELRYAFQVKRGPRWTQYIRDMVMAMLPYAHERRRNYVEYEEGLTDVEYIMVEHPDFGAVPIRTRRD